MSSVLRLAAGLFCLASAVCAGTGPLNRAMPLYESTEYEASLKILAADPSPDAATWALTGKNYFMLGRYREASEAFKRASALDPKNAEDVLWMGRALGRRAEKSSFLTAPALASEARQYFEKAVALAPGYREALNDLFSFYLEAPALIGGGLDKAETIAVKTKSLSAAQYEFDEAQIALKKKDYRAGEAHLLRAFDLAPEQAGRAVDLAKFYAKQGRQDESDKWFARADQIAPQRPASIFARAQTYLESGRQAEARKLLQVYLNASITPDDPPRDSAAKLLRQTTGNAS